MLRNLAATRSFGVRLFHSTRPLFIDPKTAEEVKIPMPWGHIAGKWWGDKTVQPILALHGILDNCASFDNLLPLIEAPSVLALDLLGHGKSSHISHGLNYDFKQNIICLRYLIKEHFKWKKVNFLCHSFGSATAFVYTGLYPDNVGNLISLDCARFAGAAKANASHEFICQAIETAFKYENFEVPALSFDEHLKKFMDHRQSKGGAISTEASTIILKRNLNAVEGDKYVFSIDPRLPFYVGRVTLESLNELATRIKSRVLTVCFDSGLYHGVWKEMLERQNALMKNSSSNDILTLKGKHHEHLEKPDEVASEINSFLKLTT